MSIPTGRRAETRARIIEAASRLFRERGIDGAGVDAIMAEAGLTHGGFYLHFASKEALAAEVCVRRLEASADRWEAAEALDRIVDSYLSLDQGCPLVCLGAELGRRADADSGVGGAAERMAAALARLSPGGGMEQGWAALSTLVGAVTLARACGDPDKAAAILAAARARCLPPDGVCR
jgi:TetR/AcrR family transcriptional repressor of nem operon